MTSKLVNYLSTASNFDILLGKSILDIDNLRNDLPWIYNYYYDRFQPGWNHDMMAQHYIGVIADYYKLSKDGEPILKPVVFLQAENENLVYNKENKLSFNLSGHYFEHNSKIHNSFEIQSEKFKDVKFNTVSELRELEEKEIQRSRNKAEKQNGFKPLPPIKHIVLKIIIVKKIESKFLAYEVDWKW